MTTELDLARQVATGDLPSPTRVEHYSLWALRVSGTGEIARPALGETAVRPAEVWLGPEMQARCAGLPLLIEHPPGALDSEEFGSRVIGSLLLPYVSDVSGVANDGGDQLWAVSRVHDDQANEMMASGELKSTSPAVIFHPDDGHEYIDTPDGGRMLLETNPSRLDHLAALPGAGIWDDGTDNVGIRLDTEGLNMTTATTQEQEKEMADAADVEDPMVKMLAALDSMTKMCDGLTKRMDDMDEMMADKRKDAAKRKDADDDMVMDSATETSLADAQFRADHFDQAWGRTAPKPMSGEKVIAYRKRLLRPHLRHSPSYKDVNLDIIAQDPIGFAAVESAVYSDSLTASKRPEGPDDGRLIKRTRTLDSGHIATEWFGKETVFQRFSSPPLFAQGSWHTTQNRARG